MDHPTFLGPLLVVMEVIVSTRIEARCASITCIAGILRLRAELIRTRAVAAAGS